MKKECDMTWLYKIKKPNEIPNSLQGLSIEKLEESYMYFIKLCENCGLKKRANLLREKLKQLQ